MKQTTSAFILLLGILVTGNSLAATYSSGETRNTLVELYTSEGCSSCPRADHWLSKLKHDQRLWKEIFPVAFHVDYWNYLGWKDRFSKNEFSIRQRNYAAFGYADTVYTPGFFQNGREWRGWFYKPELDLAEPVKTGKLTTTITSQQITALFEPTIKLASPNLNIAILAFNRSSEIRSGENAGKQLHHDFVAISHDHYVAVDNRWVITDQALIEKLGKGEAVVFWITEGDNPTPLQITGGWL